MTPPTFVCLTNVPTPYRNFFFTELRRQLEELGWRMEVWFMARHDARRTWHWQPGDFDFPYKFLSGWTIRVLGHDLFFNWNVRWLLREVQPEALLIGGAWIDPTVWISARSPFVKKTIFWSESHLRSMDHTSSVARFLRRLALNRFRSFAVPGRLAREYVDEYVPSPQIYCLPNLVDPEVFGEAVRKQRAEQRNTQRRRALLIAARLSPEKGLVPFLESLQYLDAHERAKLALRIAGAGRLRAALQQKIAEFGDIEIHLLGDRTQQEMVRLYADADGFCLPSLADPNPLSVIEALWAGLPLLLSSRVGNHPEALENGGNGFLFDPTNPRDTADAISRWLALSDDELSTFGSKSSRIGRERFEPQAAIRAFLSDVLLPEPRPILAKAAGQS